MEGDREKERGGINWEGEGEREGGREKEIAQSLT